MDTRTAYERRWQALALLAPTQFVVVLDAALGTLRGADVWRSLQEIAPELAERVLFLSGGLPPPGPEGDAMAERWVAKSDGWEGLRSRILELRRDRS
jgi:hypothetical protein